MKTEIIEQEYQTEWKFPCLGKSKTDELVVLFASERKGTILIPNKDSEIGKFYTDWRMEIFTPITEPAIIKFIP